MKNTMKYNATSKRFNPRFISIEFIHKVQILSLRNIKQEFRFISLRNIKQEFRFMYNERPQQSGKSMIKGYIVSI